MTDEDIRHLFTCLPTRHGSMRRICEAMGVHRNTVSHWAHGGLSLPTGDRRDKLVALLHQELVRFGRLEEALRAAEAHKAA